LDGSYGNREDPINKCYRVAKKRGFRLFAVQHGGWCAGSASAPQTFDKYGTSTACKSDGEGGDWANQVYLIKGKLDGHYIYRCTHLCKANQNTSTLMHMQADARTHFSGLARTIRTAKLPVSSE